MTRYKVDVYTLSQRMNSILEIIAWKAGQQNNAIQFMKLAKGKAYVVDVIV